MSGSSAGSLPGIQEGVAQNGWQGGELPGSENLQPQSMDGLHRYMGMNGGLAQGLSSGAGYPVEGGYPQEQTFAGQSLSDLVPAAANQPAAQAGYQGGGIFVPRSPGWQFTDDELRQAWAASTDELRADPDKFVASEIDRRNSWFDGDDPWASGGRFWTPPA